MELTIDGKQITKGGTKVIIESKKGLIMIINIGTRSNFSYRWGSYGKDFLDFIISLDKEYFANKFSFDRFEIDVKKTFTEVRRFIKEDLEMPFYRHPEFQKDMREKIKDFQLSCEENDKRYFVGNIESMVKRFDYSLIKEDFDRRVIKEDFISLYQEPWYLAIDKFSTEFNYLMELFTELKKELIKLKNGKNNKRNKS